MDIRIGVAHAPRELSFESEQTAEEIEAAVTQASKEGSMLRLVDKKGSVVIVPGASILYVEIGAPRKGGVGFGNL